MFTLVQKWNLSIGWSKVGNAGFNWVDRKESKVFTERMLDIFLYHIHLPRAIENIYFHHVLRRNMFYKSGSYTNKPLCKSHHKTFVKKKIQMDVFLAQVNRSKWRLRRSWGYNRLANSNLALATERLTVGNSEGEKLISNPTKQPAGCPIATRQVTDLRGCDLYLSGVLGKACLKLKHSLNSYLYVSFVIFLTQLFEQRDVFVKEVFIELTCGAYHF